MRIALVVYVALCIALLAQGIHYYPELPEQVAQHFDMQGNPNGWAGKKTLVAMMAFLVAIITGSFIGLGYAFGSIPDRYFNLPNRDYWLDPERRSTTIDYLRAWMTWFGSGTLVLILIVMEGVYRYNTSEGGSVLGAPFAIALVSYISFTIAATAHMLIRFSSKPKDTGGTGG